MFTFQLSDRRKFSPGRGAVQKKNHGVIKLITTHPEGCVNVRAKFNGTTSVHISLPQGWRRSTNLSLAAVVTKLHGSLTNSLKYISALCYHDNQII